MRLGPICICWANLTPCSLKALNDYIESFLCDVAGVRKLDGFGAGDPADACSNAWVPSQVKPEIHRADPESGSTLRLL
jgi:hypothetical protein